MAIMNIAMLLLATVVCLNMYFEVADSKAIEINDVINEIMIHVLNEPRRTNLSQLSDEIIHQRTTKEQQLFNGNHWMFSGQ